MGIQSVHLAENPQQTQDFMRAVLCDMQALEYMIQHNWIESGVRRIGAEQEMCLIDKFGRPASINMEILKDWNPEWLTTELARFNLECNLNPQFFEGDCFAKVEAEIMGYLSEITKKIGKRDAQILLTGILPTIRKTDMQRENITPVPRYYALLDSLRAMRGDDHEVFLSGIDELRLKHDSPFLEACNTSFQVHLQVSAEEFVKMYNISLAIAAPVMAVAANSPLLFGKRLWHETRIALFQQSVDTRVSHDHLRERSPRVTFGNDWLHHSILDIYREDISRYRPVLSTDIEENSLEMVHNGQVPKLRALQVSNSTVYRWNRPCYGITNGKPHLRIENRILPAGPTVLDEVANAAFWLGLMQGMSLRYDDLRTLTDFSDVSDNFTKATRYGMDSKFTWFHNEKIGVVDLVKNQLIDIAKEGLRHQKVNEADITKYMDVILGRCEAHCNGARWQLLGFNHLRKQTNKDETLTTLTAAMLKNQNTNKPVHTWKMPELTDLVHYEPTQLRVEDFMTTDLMTVQKDDILELVANIMNWQQTRYIPVEDGEGKLVGFITARMLLKHFVEQANHKTDENNTLLVKDIMFENPITVTPDTLLGEALDIMELNTLDCIPVVKDGELVGVLSEMNVIEISRRLLRRASLKAK
jgi:CBS domain-containing protein/gamma-glutamylcysteine synthetase